MILVFFSYFGYFKFLKKPEVVSNEDIIIEENSFSSNTIKDVNYVSKDAKGNEYIINASKGIDIKSLKFINQIFSESANIESKKETWSDLKDVRKKLS